VYLNRSDKLPKQVVIREDRLLGYTLVGGKESYFLCIDIDPTTIKLSTIDYQSDFIVMVIPERQRWTYGRRKQFYWGIHPLKSSEDKWVFYFETTKLARVDNINAVKH